jgi:RNA polymerase sigma factor (TIGR02999 family)
VIDGGLDASVYDELRRIAGRIHASRPGHDTLHPTELLHEAWEKAARSTCVYRDRAHFVAVAATAMRQILIDRARRRRTARHDGGARTTLSGVGDEPAANLDVLDLDAALVALEQVDARCARVALLRTFGGLSVAEVAAVLDATPRQIESEWTFARAWIGARLSG